MRVASVLCVLGSVLVLSGEAVAQQPPVDHGRFGIWYRSSNILNLPDDDGDIVPTLERAGDSRLPPFFQRLAPPALITFGKFVSQQVNVDNSGHNILGDAANEPSLAVDPNDQNRIVVGWRQFDNVASNFRQAGNAYSSDGGVTWHSNTVLQPGVFRSDPVLSVDANGTFFYNSLMQTFFDDVWRSNNSGISWLNLGPATGGDKQWMTIDRTNSPGKGNFYQCWSTAGNNYGGRQFSRSTNGSLSWMDPINIPGSPVWGTLDVATNGDLYLCGLSDPFRFVRSSNAKNPAVTPIFDRVTQVELGGSIVYGSFVNPAGLLGQAWIVTDRSTGPTQGNIYMLCSVGVDAGNPCQVNFVRSTDGGITWSAPKTLNTDARGQGSNHWFGTLSVAPNGRLDACWNDTRANPTTAISALFYTSSFDGGQTWTPNTQVSPLFNPNIGYPNQNKMGDYLGMVSDNGGAHIAYSATLNGEEDIWHLRIPSIAGFSANATSVSVYQGTYRAGKVASVWNSDAATYDVSSVYIDRLGQAAAIQADYLASPGSSSLSLKLRVSTGAATTGMVWLYNWTTSRYDVFGTFSIPVIGFKDVTVDMGTSAGAYVAQNGTVRALFRALTPLRTNGPTFLMRVDLMRLLFG